MRRLKSNTIQRFLAYVFMAFSAMHLCAQNEIIQPGAWNTKEYISFLQGKKVGVVANRTSAIGKVSLIDSLVHLGIHIEKIFAPEHGFRGEAANGEEVKDGKDPLTGIPIVSLYGAKVKPKHEDLHGLDVMVFDLQDVGVRFYTYLTTLHYVMAACAENHLQLIVLDRPNPNGYYMDGPVLDTAFRSMVGLHPIPIVHGMTLGELARMINGEKWLHTKDTCPLKVIKVKHWDHNRRYVLPTPPSPNLATPESIILYPTLGLLEGTVMSMGRGTEHPFECFGSPWLKSGRYKFVPRNIPGKATNPPFVNDTCYGFLVSDFARNYLIDLKSLYVEWLELLLRECPNKDKFFNPFFDKLAGTAVLRQQLMKGKSAEDIRKSWRPQLDKFAKQRAPYLLYDYDEQLGLLR